MLLEKQIESAIITAIEGLQIDDVDIFGSWQKSEEGTVKSEEGADSRALVVVGVAPRSYDSFSLPEISFDCVVSVVIRVDQCPTGSELEEIYEPISDLLETWNTVNTGEMITDLTIDDRFSPGGVNVSGGSGPEYRDGSWIINNRFTLRGTLLQASNN